MVWNISRWNRNILVSIIKNNTNIFIDFQGGVVINRIYKHENTVKKAVQDSVQKIDKGDVVGQVSYSQSLAFDFDKLHSIDDVSYSAVYCRLFDDGKVGNACVNNPDHTDIMIKNAKESAIFGESLEIELPDNNNYNTINWLYSDKNIQYNKSELKDISGELLSEIKKFAPQAKVSTGAQNNCSQLFLNNTSGFVGEYETSSLSIYGGLFELADDESFLEMYESQTFYDDNYDFTFILTELKQRLERSRQASVLKKTGKMPVIFAPSSVDMLLSPIEIAVNGKTLYKELSLFANRVDEQMFDKKFTFIDDPYYHYGGASAPFDDEGTIGAKLNIIEKGIFKNFIYDCTIAKKMNTKTTGHASRSSLALPTPALSNRILGIGDSSLEEMIASVDYGLMLIMSLGEGQSNMMAGDFSVLAETAYLIENGQLKGKVKDIMLSGNVFELLKNIPMLENKIHKENSLFTPHILLDGVMISKNI